MKRKLIMVAALLVVAVMMFWAFYHGLTVKIYEVKTNKLNYGESLRIVLLSDLHSCIYGKQQSKLIAKVREQNPDIILLAGDIADDERPIDGTRFMLEGLQGVAPMFYVTGNHEYWIGEISEVKELFRSYGVTVLEDEYQEIVVGGIPLVIAGVDDPEWVRYEKKEGSGEQIMKAKFKELDDVENYKILVAHRPEMIEVYKKYSFDLVVSGHAHGGQVRIPWILNGLYAPNQGWLPPYAGGAYKHETLTHVVSRGLSKNIILPRIFNPPEVVVIHVEGER